MVYLPVPNTYQHGRLKVYVDLLYVNLSKLNLFSHQSCRYFLPLALFIRLRPLKKALASRCVLWWESLGFHRCYWLYSWLLSRGVVLVLLSTLCPVHFCKDSLVVLSLSLSLFSPRMPCIWSIVIWAQALVQFSDATTANAAKSALEGRSIPRYFLLGHEGLGLEY